MRRKLLIFGNGLGMAVDHQHFSLARALNSVWERRGGLTTQQKELISRCIDHDGAPEGEHELDLLHVAVTSCETLEKIGGGRVHWLSDEGQQFPVMTARYIHKVATDLHNFDGELPSGFVESLVKFVKKTKSHVATLNYDKLLYNAFIDNDIFNGYSGYLVDGMTVNQGFDEDNLERLYGRDFGYYLHLHGSPLFINKDGRIKKLSRDQLDIDTDRIGRHIVLTHVKHKPKVIAASEALSAYWNYLRFSISEVAEVILIGYSGLDVHLNSLLRPYLKNIRVRVIEWEGAGEQRDRRKYWKNELGKPVDLIRLRDITEFRDW